MKPTGVTKISQTVDAMARAYALLVRRLIALSGLTLTIYAGLIAMRRRTSSA